jgi:hypothetical protein
MERSQQTELPAFFTHVAHASSVLTLAVPSSSISHAFIVSSDVIAEGAKKERRRTGLAYP